MPRFFADGVKDGVIKITGEDAGHIFRVLRGKPGDTLTVCDGRGTDYEARITEAGASEIILEAVSQSPTQSEPKLSLTLYQALPKADKMELIIQKCVELGVYRIVPVNTERCVVKIEKNKEAKKLDRWRKISESAAKQSGRGLIPEIGSVMDFGAALKEAAQNGRAIIPYELEQDRSLRDFLDGLSDEERAGHLAVFIGPEGGFTESEIVRATEQGVVPITLGKRILRTETAGMAVVANVMFYIS